MNLSPRKQLFVDTASEMFGNGAVLSKPQIREAAAEASIPFHLGLKDLKLVITNFNYHLR